MEIPLSFEKNPTSLQSGLYGIGEYNNSFEQMERRGALLLILGRLQTIALRPRGRRSALCGCSVTKRGRWKPSGRGGTKLWRLLPPGEAEEGLSIPSDQHEISNDVVTSPFRQAVPHK
eukprot:scaffold325253_cov18-Prasinocladus_malaysianus.AAC.1